MESDTTAGTGYEVYQEDTSEGAPQKSIEGWILIVRGVLPEAAEDNVVNHFEKYGALKNIHLNLDRRTGFVKGYAFIEYEKFEEAKAAVENGNGSEMLGGRIQVDWAFRGAPRRK
eukprot:GHVP01069164.1.p1 GENE.GHVP01069164.1~~GHVP01069164.1.p1  ORF type:complete len:131 (-),score=31.60 GHVP01069164.1:502-846(-)